MPIQVSSPGAHVSAITSPQPPTGGTSTSIAAFVGRTPMGPVNTATPLLNTADYASTFGGLNKDSTVSYQVSAFFNNGGNQAVGVRVYSPPWTTSLTVGGAPVKSDTYNLQYSVLTASGTASTLTAATSTLHVQGVAPSGTVTAQQGTAQAIVNAINGNTDLKGVVSASVATGSSQVTITMLPALTTSTTSIAAVTWTVDPVTATSSTATPGGTLTLVGPATQSNTGASPVPLYPSAVVTISGAVAVGSTYEIVLTPPGSPAILLSTTATTTSTLDVATALADAINANAVAKGLVSASAASEQATPANSVLTLTYLGAVAVAMSPIDSMTLTHGSPLLSLQAANPGVWGNQITAAISLVSPTTHARAYQSNRLSTTDPTQALFNLTVWYFDGTSYQSESFVNVTLAGDDDQANRLDRVLENGSRYVRCTIPTTLPWLYPQTGFVPATFVGFGANAADSLPLHVTDYLGSAAAQTGIYALRELPYGWNILCIPPDDPNYPNEAGTEQSSIVYQAAAQLCVENNAMLILDPPTTWFGLWQSGQVASIRVDDPLLGSYTADQARSAALYFPCVVIADPLLGGRPRTMPPCGFMAAVWASTDTASGVWKAPAGLDAPIGGIIALQGNLTNDDEGALNPQGINVLRSFKVGGDVVFGARTMRGSDMLADPYKYVPVRRLLLYIETSLLQDTKWAVFQPNGPSLWSRLQDQVTTFMNGLFTQGAFSGTSASQAYFVKCDASTTTPTDQAAGVVNVQVGFAPLYPGEFVVITVQQQAGAQSG